MLRKIRVFKQRVLYAHNILQQGYHENHITLSTLTKVNLHQADTILNIGEETDNTLTEYEPVTPKTCKEYQPVVLLTDIKTELLEELNIICQNKNDLVHEPENTDFDFDPGDKKKLMIKINTKIKGQSQIHAQEQLNINNEDNNDSVCEPENSDFVSEPDEKKNLIKPIEINRNVNKKQSKINAQEQLNMKSQDKNDSVNKPENTDFESKSNKKKNSTKPIETNTKDKKQSKIPKFQRYNKMGTSVENKNLDFDNDEQNFTDICLSEADMGSLSLGDKRSYIHSREVRCQVCNLAFDNYLFRQMHNTFYHLLRIEKKKVKMQCNACRKCFADIVSLRKHWMTHSEAAKCNLCGFIVDRKHKRRHIEAHKYYTQCNHCNAIFYSRVHLSYHFNTLHRRLKCDHCNKQFRSKRMLISHMRQNHLPFKCEKCNKFYKTFKLLENHIYLRHKKPPCNPELAFCVECNKQFVSVERYKGHLLGSVVHNPKILLRQNKKISCPGCGEQFARNIYMRNHYNLKHKGVTDHQCETCHKYFGKACSLKLHINSVHLKIRPPKNKICDLCGRGFSCNMNLNKHMRTHTGERPYKCPQCPAAFSQKHPLVTHMRTQHKVPDPYSALRTTLTDR